MKNNSSRRDFIKGAAGAVTLTALASGDAAAQTGSVNQQTSGEIPRRPLGRTGAQVSIIGVGGADIGKYKNEREAVRIVQTAVDAGINFMDNAWEYNDGASEEYMGKALADRRDKVFLMSKVCTHGRDKQTAIKMLEDSLRRLKTDYLDLWQVHECIYYNDPERHFEKNGVMEALSEAKRAGKVRFVGFTGHKDPAIHLKMLSYNYPFDTCQHPVNPFDANFNSFEKQVLPELKKRGIASIGMKSLGGGGEALKKNAITVEEALRYAMSLPISVLVSGMPTLGILEQNLAIVRNFKPMTTAEMQALRARVASVAADGRFELYKTSKKYDAKEGRQQHGFPTKEEELTT